MIKKKPGIFIPGFFYLGKYRIFKSAAAGLTGIRIIQ